MWCASKRPRRSLTSYGHGLDRTTHGDVTKFKSQKPNNGTEASNYKVVSPELEYWPTSFPDPRMEVKNATSPHWTVVGGQI
jgi:hypothetical protein